MRRRKNASSFALTSVILRSIFSCLTSSDCVQQVMESVQVKLFQKLRRVRVHKLYSSPSAADRALQSRLSNAVIVLSTAQRFLFWTYVGTHGTWQFYGSVMFVCRMSNLDYVSCSQGWSLAEGSLMIHYWLQASATISVCAPKRLIAAEPFPPQQFPPVTTKPLQTYTLRSYPFLCEFMRPNRPT